MTDSENKPPNVALPIYAIVASLVLVQKLEYTNKFMIIMRQKVLQKFRLLLKQ
jgi:hypothetical protein